MDVHAVLVRFRWQDRAHSARHHTRSATLHRSLYCLELLRAHPMQAYDPKRNGYRLPLEFALINITAGADIPGTMAVGGWVHGGTNGVRGLSLMSLMSLMPPEVRVLFC